jgi:hypothetical protein
VNKVRERTLRGFTTFGFGLGSVGNFLGNELLRGEEDELPFLPAEWSSWYPQLIL